MKKGKTQNFGALCETQLRMFLAEIELFLIVHLAVGVLLAQECYELGSLTYCRDYTLKIDEPLEVDFSHDSIVIHTSNGNISSKTLSLLTDRKELKIMISRISYVEDGVLCSPPTMQKLVVEYNIAFPVLTESLLSNCEHIRTLRIHSVEMEPNALKHMTSLQGLSLSHMKIPHLNKTYLGTLKELKKISFSGCEIQEIDPATICTSSKLVEISLAENMKFPPLTKSLFEGCTNVEDLQIFHNRTTFVNIDEDALSEFTRLKRFEANNLIINHLTKKHFGNMNSLEWLFLVGCNITEIDRDAFVALTNLKKLQIIGSNLNNEHLHVLENLNNLEQLDLSGNNLDSIDSLKFPKLKYLRVVRNSISTVDVNKVISNLPELEGLFIYDNPMSCTEKRRISEDIRKPGRFAMTVFDSRNLNKEDC